MSLEDTSLPELMQTLTDVEQATPLPIRNTKDLARHNRDSIRAYLIAHPGALNKECARALGLSPRTVTVHVAAIRLEWYKPGGGA